MKLSNRTPLFALLIRSCRGFTFNIPDSVVKDRPTKFAWSMNSSDIKTLNSTNFVIFLINTPDEFHCPGDDIPNRLGANKDILIEHYVVQKSPQNDSSSGEVVFEPQKSGDLNLDKFERLRLLDESHTFGVNGSYPSQTPYPSATSSSSPGDSQCQGKDNGKCHKNNGLAALVGGIMGGMALLCILAAGFFYRQFRYQKKLNQFHKEHQLLHQAPPSSILVSTLTNPNRYPAYGGASPPPEGSRDPISPAITRRASHVPLGFDETLQKSYHLPSVVSSPSSDSDPLSQEPALRAQHGPGAGASNL
ncbi:hypothetical protein AAF712_016299 [Marasmius tenuissimus]|uniref:Uncharacterized protein n=1 Tax=Marasmius tenuissimus TaxID=585030 RepID=A0ABR2Z893_9AGAR